MKPTVGSIFRDHFEEYTHRYPQSLIKLKAITSFMRCRTAAMGGHLQYCPQGHIEKAHYNSCKHRNCPACNALPTARWLERQKAMILDCDHYHAIFTLPHYLLALWNYNTRLMADLLFRCAIDTLRKLLDDPRHLGAAIGILASLHTWSRALGQHPHLHLLITGGGRTPEGEWKAVTGDFLLPYRIVRKIFRAKYVEALNQAYQAGELRLPPGLQEEGFERLMKKVATRVKWRTHICEPYRHGKGVVTYLARYVKGGPFKNTQILSDTHERITFRYTDHRDNRKKPCTLHHDEFMRRILWHIPEKGHQRIRYYGLYHSHKKALRQQCRQLLGQSVEPAPEAQSLSWEQYMEQLGISQPGNCPVCSAPLVIAPIAIIPHQQSPPKPRSGCNPVH